MIHDIKIKQCYLIHILEGRKTFEVRFNDRDYQVGDELHFLPLVDENYDVYKLKSPIPNFMVTYINHDYGMKDGYVVLGIKQIK